MAADSSLEIDMPGMRILLPLILILATPTPGLADQPGHRPRPAGAGSQERNPAVLLRQLPGLRHAFAMVRLELGDVALQELPPTRRAQETAAYSRKVARWAEFERLVDAVVGRPREHLAYRDVLAAFVAEGPFPMPVDADALARDRIVLVMAMAGYGPGLIADVVTGRLTMEMVEQAAKRRLLGHTDAEIARSLEAHVVARAAVPSPVAAATPGAARTIRERFDPVLVRHAQRHDVDPDLVRAVITHESAWNAAARSHKGAIGLMQLMPETARLLGVNPVDPEQNIAGGVRYLADLRALFAGNLDAMIVGYVAGPTYAQRWLRGTMVLDHEVRAYLDNVKGSYRRRNAWGKD